MASNWVLYKDGKIIREPFDPKKPTPPNYKVVARAPATSEGLAELQARRNIPG